MSDPIPAHQAVGQVKISSGKHLRKSFQNSKRHGSTASNWSRIGTVPVNLSIKNAPDEVVRRLKERAERHHRSLQGELLAIIEAAIEVDPPMTPFDLLARVRSLKLDTPNEAAAIVRADRDERQGR